MKFSIKRTRYVIVNDKGEIFCGLVKNYQFKPIDNIGNTAIKTYLSENKAKSSFLDSWWEAKKEDFETGRFLVVPVTESVETL